MFASKVQILTRAALLSMTVLVLPVCAPVFTAHSDAATVGFSPVVLVPPAAHPAPPVLLPPSPPVPSVPVLQSPAFVPPLSRDKECLRAAYGHIPAAVAVFDDAVVLETLAQAYPLEPHRPAPHVGEHPGRVRSYALLGAVYGHTKAEVQAQLHTVIFMGQSVRLSAGAAPAFARVAKRLTILAQEQPRLKAYMLPVGAFIWRPIARETRLSPHSFGIAVDLNPDQGPYWLWAAPSKRAAQSAAARATYPADIVAAFEAEGFIWGGKWYEYDMMHFEYRPELICKARALDDSATRSE